MVESNSVRFPPSLVVLLCAIAASAVWADDWPMVRHDAARSGISTETLALPLSEVWTLEPAHPPAPAWGDPQPKPIENQLELPRSRFDDAFHAVIADDTVFFGSSADHTVYALDAQTGNTRWKYVTDGPIRLAPTVWGQKVYVGSDDGKVYCLDSTTGRTNWVFSAAPGPEMGLGNGKMISLWPVRTGVLVQDGIAYFGAGVFPAEGVYLYAVDAEKGIVLWKNDSFGRGGQGTVSPQGYLLASQERLFVSSNRAMPAVFRLKDGEFLFHRNFSWREIGMFGGTFSVLADGLLFNAVEQVVAVRETDGRVAFTEGIGPSSPSEGARRMVVSDDVVYLVTGVQASAFRREPWIAERSLGDLQRRLADLRQRAKSNPQIESYIPPVEKQIRDATRTCELLGPSLLWRVPCRHNDSIVLTHDVVLIGGSGNLLALDTKTGETRWTAPVEGKARGLAVSGGRVVVSTDRGALHCFASQPVESPARITPVVTEDPFSDDGERSRLQAKAAGEIVESSGVRRGYALVLGGQAASLALALVRQSELNVYLVEPDLDEVVRARQAFDSAGVHGARVTVLHAPLGSVPYADYFANLIVCADGFSTGVPVSPASEVLRMLKPHGGIAFAGRPPALSPSSSPSVDAAQSEGLGEWVERLRSAAESSGPSRLEVTRAGDWARIERGPLVGAGSWTHQYAEPGNTATSDDRVIQGPIGILWYGEPGPERMPSRHAANVAPVAIAGRLFTEGENVVMAHDAYNGLLLWQRDLPGALRLRMLTGVSNFVADESSVFVAIGDQCLRLEATTGSTQRTYRMPPASDGNRESWMYTAHSDGILYGSRGTREIFAVDVDTGELRWRYEGGAIQLTTIVIGDGSLFLVDKSVTEEEAERAAGEIPGERRVDRRGNPVPPDVRRLVALDARTGEKKWERLEYVSDCVGVGSSGGELTAMYSKGVLVLCGQPWNGHFWREFFAGEFSRRSLIALDAKGGEPLWSGRKGYRSRPIIVGDMLVAEPWAYDLRTGADKLRTHPVTGVDSRWQMARPGHHCGGLAACPGAIFFRSGTTAYYDLVRDEGTEHFGAQRPGCWINCIPANGVVLMPEASSGCVCPYSVHCTIVFKPRATHRVWGMFSAPGPLTPVRNLAVNFGAPGDRRDSQGRLWLAYPRPYSGETETDRRLVLHVPLEVELGPGGTYFEGNADFLDIPKVKDSWIYASSCEGLARCTVPVGAEGSPERSYTVRLHFRDPRSAPGERTFGVALQGKEVFAELDIARDTEGAGGALVKEISGVRATDRIELRLQATRGPPLLCGVEVTVED